MKSAFSRAGFTLAEMLMSFVVMVLVVAASVTGYIYVLQGEKLNSAQAGLDVDVRVAINSLRHDLRLSDMANILFYPAGPGPYSGLSFPMATPNPSGLLNYDTNGLIAWDKTVVYHVWSGNPSQLRKTVFSPRCATATVAQRQAQLNGVVAAGNGASSTLGAETATTSVIFNNLVQWNILPQQAIFDGYSSNTQRAVNYNLGSIALSPGAHQFKFTTIGKNPLSSNYTIGLDTLVMSPSGLEREAEAQALVNGSATAAYMPNGGWSGNYRLLSPCTATGQYFTLSMENDRWEETNFRGGGSVPVGTLVTFDQTLNPNDFVVCLEGPGYTWQAPHQTLDAVGGSTSNGALRGSAVRVLLRGRDMPCGNNILYNGSVNYVCFMASTSAPLSIVKAYLSECSTTAAYSMDAAPTNSVQLLFNGTSDGYIIPAGGTVWAWASTPYQIDKTKSYLVSFLIETAASRSDAYYWTEGNPGAPGCWMLPTVLNPDDTMTRQATWSSLNPVPTNLLFGVYGMYTTCPTNGTFTSQIVDTHQAAPLYSDVGWNASLPTNSYLALLVRSGNQPDLADAPAWSNVTAVTTPGSINPGSGRYVQFHARFRPDPTLMNTPKLKDVTIRWAGVQQIVDVGGTFSQGPDHGIWQLTVDGNPLVKGVNMDMTIYKDMPVLDGKTRRMTSTVSMEIYPRNTGK